LNFSSILGTIPSKAGMLHNVHDTTVKALISRHPQDIKKVSVTGAGHLRDGFSQTDTGGVGERWPLMGACPVFRNVTRHEVD